MDHETKDTMQESSDAALLWAAQHVGKNHYWDVTVLSDLVDSMGLDDDNNKQQLLSYASLGFLTRRLSRKLWGILWEKWLEARETTATTTQTQIMSTTDVRSLTVAVAIPEGPFLPIAIATVHAMNRPSASPPPSQFGETFTGQERLSCALLPLEPTEGVDRLHLMMRDARPFLILSAGRDTKDSKRLERLVADVSSSKERYSPLIVDFVKCVEEVMKGSQEEMSMSQTLEVGERFGAGPKLRSFLLGDDRNEQDDVSCKRISHIVYTSGTTTGKPKGCVSSVQALDHYIHAKNKVHGIDRSSTVLLASSLSFDPCLSDILATLACGARLALAPKPILQSALHSALLSLHVTHILCTPTLFGSSLVARSVGPNSFPHLQVVALGGEPIPRRIRHTWARKRTDDCSGYPKLMATFGVTEACVYQTAGEIAAREQIRQHELPGQDVGRPFPGLSVRICQEEETNGGSVLHPLVNVDKSSPYPHNVGEVVLSGTQVDSLSCYLNQEELSRQKFVVSSSDNSSDGAGTVHYRTGDRGFLDPVTGNLFILGRIGSEAGMVKINGVRVELGEMERSLVDNDDADDDEDRVELSSAVIVDSMVVPELQKEESSPSAAVQRLAAYVVLGQGCQYELVKEKDIPSNGAICTGPLLTLLRERCRRKLRVIPNTFVVLPGIPLSPTGKRDPRGVPPLSDAVPLDTIANNGTQSMLLEEYGVIGALLAEQIKDCLNLLPSQQTLLTTSATFEMLGGDSLASTRVVRALYARFHKVDDNRFLGGQHGILDDDRFSAVHLIRASSLGSYVDYLAAKAGGMLECGQPQREATAEVTIERHDTNNMENSSGEEMISKEEEEEEEEARSCQLLSDALLEASTQGQCLLAMALLEVDADFNVGVADSSRHRLGKIGSRLERKQVFASTPLHHACLRGNPLYVQALLRKGAKTAAPDASGNFPIHLAASGSGNAENTPYAECKREDDERRWECVRLMLDYGGVPLTVKDGNKQTILHSAARAGRDYVLLRILDRWKPLTEQNHKLAESLNWRDRWSRTAVHWAILNGHESTLRVLLEAGCSADPPMPSRNKRTSAALERPLELCDRLYGTGNKGLAIKALLERFKD